MAEDPFILHFQLNIKYFYLNIYEAHFDLYTKMTTATISACCKGSFGRGLLGKYTIH